AWNMSEPHKWRGYMTERLSDKFLLVVTLGLTVLVDLTAAIAVGVGIGLALRLRRRNIPPADWTPPDA
ncbi:MAG: SulP family inorganic anion transporter, partial [Albidovulum sp.]